MRYLSMDYETKVLTLVVLFIGLATGVLLNGKCDVDANCGTLDSFCKNGTCSCFEDFTTFEDSCVKVIIPKVDCKSNADCKFRPRAMCLRGTCTCRPFHHEENGQCIKSRVLEEPCDKDFQCYWGQKMKNKMGCVEGKCYCKPGYVTSDYKECVAVPVVPVQGVSSRSSRTSMMPLIVPLIFCIKLSY